MPAPSESSVALAEVLSEGGEEAAAITARFDRSMLWRLRTGRRLPELETAVALQELSGGRIDAAGWLRPAPKVARRGRRASSSRAKS